MILLWIWNDPCQFHGDLGQGDQHALELLPQICWHVPGSLWQPLDHSKTTYIYICVYIYIKSKETTNKSEDALERFGDVVVNVLCFVFLFFGWFSGSLVAWLFGCLVPCLFYCFLFCSCCWLSSVLAGGGSGGAPSQKLAFAMALSPTAATAATAIPEARFAQREVGQLGAEDDSSFGHKKHPFWGVSNRWVAWGTAKVCLNVVQLLVGNLGKVYFHAFFRRNLFWNRFRMLNWWIFFDFFGINA